MDHGKTLAQIPLPGHAQGFDQPGVGDQHHIYLHLAGFGQ
jgi:hypothetical protein